MADLNFYLVAKYLAMPKDPKQTAKPGYMLNPENIEYDEQVYIIRGLHNKYLKNQVILNLTEEKIVKNLFKSGANFHEVLEHFVEGYGDYINESIEKINAISGH